MTVSDFFVKHERLVIVLAVVLIVAFLSNAWTTHTAADAKAKSDAASQVLQAQTDANNSLKQIIQQQGDRYEALVRELAAQNAQLLGSIATRTAATKKQQGIDATLDLNDTAIRMRKLAPLQPNDVQIANNSLALSLDGSRAVVGQLELVPALQQDLDDGKQILLNKDKQIVQLTDLQTTTEQQVTGLEAQLADATKSCNADKDALKKEARAGKLRWFKWGFVTGYVSGLVTHILVTH